ncbi:hypothetical protein [Sphingobacterium siyangense]|uniref:hypothetical protein n=1 Tax=Sphingobacterium siyangense TaxID=459529 RepID=UPI00289E1DE9|nr:hypothetical protein [Sphingobacterium siyangense]
MLRNSGSIDGIKKGKQEQIVEAPESKRELDTPFVICFIYEVRLVKRGDVSVASEIC